MQLTDLAARTDAERIMRAHAVQSGLIDLYGLLQRHVYSLHGPSLYERRAGHAWRNSVQYGPPVMECQVALEVKTCAVIGQRMRVQYCGPVETQQIPKSTVQNQPRQA